MDGNVVSFVFKTYLVVVVSNLVGHDHKVRLEYKVLCSIATRSRDQNCNGMR